RSISRYRFSCGDGRFAQFHLASFSYLERPSLRKMERFLSEATRLQCDERERITCWQSLLCVVNRRTPKDLAACRQFIGHGRMLLNKFRPQRQDRLSNRYGVSSGKFPRNLINS